MQCSGDALANRLKLLLKSQRVGSKMIGEMMNSILEVKDDAELQVTFLNG